VVLVLLADQQEVLRAVGKPLHLALLGKVTLVVQEILVVVMAEVGVAQVVLVGVLFHLSHMLVMVVLDLFHQLQVHLFNTLAVAVLELYLVMYMVLAL
jgi:hypothetical protein